MNPSIRSERCWATSGERLFEKSPQGGRVDHFLVQLGMLLRGGREGGFFVMLGRRRDASMQVEGVIDT